MKKLPFLILVFSLSFLSQLHSQKDIQSFIFGHSLINHEFKKNPTPSQETSVPHWMHFLATSANHNYAVDGQYGFLPQHANVPPIAQWGFDFVPGAWSSDTEPFSAADFDNIMITPGNFIQWQGPTMQYPGENVSPFSATRTVFDWAIRQEPKLKFYIYENWPDMAEFLSNDFPPSLAEWTNYNNYLNQDFHNWFLAYQDLLTENFPDRCIGMIPVGPVISQLLQKAPYNQIPISELYEDDAPHGRPNIYFLAALTTYMTMYEEKAPANFQTDSILHPIIRNNYSAIVDFIWNELDSFNYPNGESRVFCSNTIVNTNTTFYQANKITVYPNPSKGLFNINSNLKPHFIDLYSYQGKILQGAIPVDNQQIVLDLGQYPNGLFWIIGRNEQGQTLYQQKLAKF